MPVGAVVPLSAATVAVNVTDWPDALGFCDDASWVVVPVTPAARTCWVKVAMLLEKFPVGMY